MAATPKTGTWFFKGSRGTYNVNVYVSDVAGALVTLNANGTAIAGSPTQWRAPENVVLVDFAMTTGTADTTNLIMQQDNANKPASLLPYATFLTTISTRPQVNLSFPAGSLIGAQQNA